MDSPTALSRYIPQNSKKMVFLGGSSSSGRADVEVLEVPPPVSSKQKEKVLSGPSVGGSSSPKEEFGNDGAVVLSDSTNADDYNSNFFYGEDGWMESYSDDIISDDNSNLESHFVDIPPGVEAPLPWFPSSPRNDAKVPTSSSSAYPVTPLHSDDGTISPVLSTSPDGEVVWLEACQRHIDVAKAVIGRGIMEIPNSVKLCMQAAKLEADKGNKIRVLRKGLENVPNSLSLWEAVVELANEEDTRLLLQMAVEYCPLHLDFWLALSKLETYENAKDVLFEASNRLPYEPAICITAAKLDEMNGNKDMVATTIERGIRALQGEGVIDREMWLKEAEAAERAGSVFICKAIIRGTIIESGVEEENQKRFWLDTAKECKNRGCVETARGIYNVLRLAALNLYFAVARDMGSERAWKHIGNQVFPVWIQYAIFERGQGEIHKEKMLLDEGVIHFPSFFEFWLMLGQWEERFGNSVEARNTYELGIKKCPKSIRLWLSLANLNERVNGLCSGRAVLTRARLKNRQNPELWLAAVHAELRNGLRKEAERLMNRALQECPTSATLWAFSIEMASRYERKMKTKYAFKRCGDDPHIFAALGKIYWNRKVDKTRFLFNRAVALAPDIGDFWALYYKFEAKHGNEETKREVLNRCIAADPKHGEKWQVISEAMEYSHQQTHTEVILMQLQNQI